MGITTALTLVTLLFSSGVWADEDLAKHWVIEREELNITVADVRSIELNNIFGNIRTRGYDGDRLEVFMVIQHHEKDFLRPQIRKYRGQDGLVLEVVYPDADAYADPDADVEKAEVPGKNKRRVDVSAFVPRQLRLKLQTSSGLAESKGHQSHLDIRTLAGNINIKTKGSVNAVTERGKITAIHQNNNWTAASAYQSKSGAIDITLTEQANIEVGIDTAGRISTDFSIDICPQPGSNRKRATATIGDANYILDINSVIGDVNLNRKINMMKSK